MTPRFSGLDANDGSTQSLLSDIQANILKGHGRAFANHIFIRWKPLQCSIESIKEWINALQLTSAYEQFFQAQAFKRSGLSNSIVRTASFSCDGLKRIGLANSIIPKDPAFREGMKFAAVTRLSEKVAAQWDIFYRKQVHCCLIIATALETEANVATTSELDRLSRQFGDGIDIQIERGWIERDAKGQVIEHFGFRDGISQPLFLKYEIDDYWASISGSPVRYDPSADPRSLILVPEAPITDSFGSFFVYRKLEQDVDGFRRACLQLAASLKKTEKDSGALVVGRQESGRPLIFDSSTSQDNFGYEIDPAGRACPLQSHIRKSNTRLALDVEARIARRGVSYGKKGVDGSVGLLFFCHVADITRQYEKIQGTWINNRSASERPSILCGPDALVATSDFSLANEHKWPINETDPASDIRFPFGKNVTVRGGEYFYTPSVKMLKVIASA